MRRQVWWAALLWLAVAARGEQRFAMEPQDQTAVEGTRVTLPCRVINKTGMLQWTKDDFGLGTDRNLSGFDRYSMIGSDEEGDYSLDIYPVMLDDDARYQCQVGPGANGEPGIRSKFAQLTVLVPPDRPRIVQGDFLVTTEDREIELECVSMAGKPAAEITWIDGLGNVLRDGIEYIVEALPDGRRFTAKSILKLTPKKEHHNTTFTCQAQNTAERTYKSAHLRLEVKYAPKVTLAVVGSNGAAAGTGGLTGSLVGGGAGAGANGGGGGGIGGGIASIGHRGGITEGADVRLACKADANPLDLTYRWYLNDEPVPGDFTTELVIHNISRRYHDAIVKCEVHNPVGKSEESETLDVNYGPKFRSRPRSVQADPGSTVTLSCDVDGNPPADIVWIHDDGTSKVVGTSVNLTLDVERHTAGRYYCKASVMGFPEVGAEATVYLKGPPTISSQRTQFGQQGDTVRLECVAYSIPKPDHVMWTFRGAELDPGDSDYTLLEEPTADGIRSALVIRDAQDRHFGAYNCSVTNPYGSDMVEILLKPQKNFPLLMILTGVIGGVIVIIVIAMIIILCQRREKKPKVGSSTADSREAEKQCKESDRSSNISDLKMELRTGSSVSNVHCELEYGPDSETGSESVVTRVGVPLAGPVALPVNGGDALYRYSAEFSDQPYPNKDGQNNNGYVPYVDYSREYTPPATLALETSRESLGAPVDPRYSAVYGNPYLRAPPAGAATLPLPLPLSAQQPVGAPAPPPYSTAAAASAAAAAAASAAAAAAAASAARNGAVPQVARLPSSPTSQYIVPSSQPAAVKRGTLATHV
ncbi:irregular chiasm C-roughest protein [Schistocerca serialis cubense]|uniref:irregular chiasm C-roughest protein n=1 Tax=Schistocerca serialis cubense TaxID=2023355 RepID=UPI00214E80A7|nr:irregular chiasm C-roughest protein [Schistocerca serialis cubense]XP_049959880.1 irregular chiasm C-roughest protein [Schistocerca serialis cubense]XP_049959881.1 irregular chiasm C-roughest protein [Schistocerca serialis cubense]XP_049959882.1 irregular chiasm C-roughest protein [Schistocerca serialis cubense]